MIAGPRPAPWPRRSRAPPDQSSHARRADGRSKAAYAGPATIGVPPDLEAALAADPNAHETFEKLSRQNRDAILYRIGNAKRPETRERRITHFVEMLARGETIYPHDRT